MKESTRNLLVGLFVIVSLVVLGLLMTWFGEAPSWLGGSEWTLRISGVKQLRGVGDGSPVNLNGVDIGRVKSLEFEDPQRPGRGVVIVAGIKNMYSIPSNAWAKVYGATLGFGTGHIVIMVPDDGRVEPLNKKQATIRGEMHSLIGEIISKEMVDSVETTIKHIGDLAAAAEPVAANLAVLLERRTVADVAVPGALESGATPNLATVVERLDRLVENINLVLGDANVQGDVKSAVRDLREATLGLKETMAVWQTESQRISENLNAGIDRTEANLDKSFAKLNAVIEKLDDVSGSLSRIALAVDRGEGTAGLLVRDPRLYEAAVLTFDRLTELVGTIQRVAGKIEEDGYITIGQTTAVGTFTKEFPVGARTRTAGAP